MKEPLFSPRPWRVGPNSTIHMNVPPEDERYSPTMMAAGGKVVCGLSNVRAGDAKLMELSPDFYDNAEDEVIHLLTLKNQIMSLLGMVKPIPLVTPEFTLKYIDQIIEETEKLLARARGEQKHDQH